MMRHTIPARSSFFRRFPGVDGVNRGQIHNYVEQVSGRKETISSIIASRKTSLQLQRLNAQSDSFTDGNDCNDAFDSMFFKDYKKIGAMLEDPRELRLLLVHHDFADLYQSNDASLQDMESQAVRVPGRPPSVSKGSGNRDSARARDKYYPANIRFTVDLPDATQDAKSEDRFREIFPIWKGENTD